MPDIQTHAQALKDETVALRRDFHRHPELGFEEVRTSGIVAEKLKALGLEVRTGFARTGVIGILDTGREGKTVLARADMDALPIHEESQKAYASTTPGKMHACGHDGHTAILLSAAKVLTNLKDDLSGKVVFIFQPAEETVGGAQKMIDEGALEGISPDATIGLHLGSLYPVGTVALRSGPAMAATDAMTITVRGRGGHAARPQETVDPVLISAHLITALQSVVSRESDPLDNVVLSLCAIHAGSAHNIIPEALELKGTLRTFKDETRANAKARIEALASTLAQSFRGSAEIDWLHGSPAVVNDDTMTQRVRAVAQEVVGTENVITPDPIMGGDDMALWLQAAPGCYFFVGARNEEAGISAPHHNPKFDVDEASLPLGVELLARGVIDFLNS